MDSDPANNTVPNTPPFGNSVYFLALPISLQESPENSHSLDPETFLGGPSILGTLPFTESSVTPFTTGFVVLTDTRPEHKNRKRNVNYANVKN